MNTKEHTHTLVQSNSMSSLHVKHAICKSAVSCCTMKPYVCTYIKVKIGLYCILCMTCSSVKQFVASMSEINKKCTNSEKIPSGDSNYVHSIFNPSIQPLLEVACCCHRMVCCVFLSSNLINCTWVIHTLVVKFDNTLVAVI